MRQLRVLAVIAALIASVGVPQPLPAQAQTPSPPEALEAANELFALLSKDMINQLATQLLAQFWPLIERDLKARNVDDAAIADLRKEFERIQLDYLADLMKDAPGIYARHFTAVELREITAFYRTPTGAKALREMPAVTAESMQAVMPRLQEVQRKTQEAFARILRERGYIK
jgi:hypothetical protein